MLPGPAKRKRRLRSLGAKSGSAFVVVLIVGLRFGLGTGGSALYDKVFGDSEKDRYPTAWDPQYAELVTFVEVERGLTFKHPIYIDRVSEADFDASLAPDEELTDDDRMAMDEIVGFLRAIGLVEGPVDLAAAGEKMESETVLAFYDSDTKHIQLPDADMGPYDRAILVHELTHALQDQHFDLNKAYEIESSGASAAFDAIVEGDATRIEYKYIEALSPADLEEYERVEAAGYEDMDTSDIPGVFLLIQSVPYIFGESFLRSVEADGGEDAINETFDAPPTTEEHLLDPYTFLVGDGPKDVPVPPLGDGEVAVDASGEADTEFGAIGWFLMLAERIDGTQAYKAVSGWGGDAYVSFRENSQICVRATFQGDNDADTLEMADALDAWAAAMHGEAATVERGDAVVSFTSCDPGPDADIRADPAPGAGDGDILGEKIGIFAGRTEVSLAFAEGGASRDVARCASYEIVTLLSPEDFMAPSQEEVSPEGAEIVLNAVARCRKEFP